MRMLTRQDHIDPRVNRIEKCMAPGHAQGEVVVIFSTGASACSSGHANGYDDIPNLRTTQQDPVAWVKENALEVVKMLPFEVCPDHEEGTTPIWIPDGHIWTDGHEHVLKLCMPYVVQGMTGWR